MERVLDGGPFGRRQGSELESTTRCAASFLLEEVQAHVLRSAMDWIEGVVEKGMIVSPTSLGTIHESLYR
jgi:hypothetical protein